MTTPIRPVAPAGLPYAQPAGPAPAPVPQGYFGGYHFHLPRAPAPPKPRARQTPPHRRRMPRSRLAPHAGGADEECEPHELQHGELIDSLDLRTPLRTGDAHTGFGQGDDRPTDDPQARLHARVAPDSGEAAVALEKRLAQAQWPGFDVLLGAASKAGPAPQTTHAHAEALVDALLASLDIGATKAGPGMDAQSVQTAAVQAYLRSCADDPRSPSTLPQIKQLLLSRAALRAHPLAPAESEPMQNRRLLLPLLLLNTFARPRTQHQRQDACDRLDLLQGRAATVRLP